ncbi:type II toxin-antitoxin system ParD family antitoxin [Capilliphycus salinus ALCB114379]|uniref:type II toxin-antitoxin system ParD family antitoxin n=1 Tax=Capilliphycus salinus TaxID=2768948 RepID=UPI0039A6A57F
MSLSLTPEVEQAIEEQVRSGRYQSANEVVQEALRLLKERDRALNEKRLEELRQKIAVGTEQISKGKVTDGEVVMENLLQKIRREYQSE